MRALLSVVRDRRNYNVSVQSDHNGAISISYNIKFWFLCTNDFTSPSFLYDWNTQKMPCHCNKKGKFNYDLHWNRIKIKWVKKSQNKISRQIQSLDKFSRFQQILNNSGYIIFSCQIAMWYFQIQSFDKDYLDTYLLAYYKIDIYW